MDGIEPLSIRSLVLQKASLGLFTEWWKSSQRTARDVNSNMQAVFKLLLASHLLMTCLPELVTWPRPDSNNGEIYPPLDGKSSKVPWKRACM